MSNCTRAAPAGSLFSVTQQEVDAIAVASVPGARFVPVPIPLAVVLGDDQR